jgi:autotransporter-associated beta strand protein
MNETTEAFASVEREHCRLPEDCRASAHLRSAPVDQDFFKPDTRLSPTTALNRKQTDTSNPKMNSLQKTPTASRVLMGSISAILFATQPAVYSAAITWNMATATPSSMNAADVSGGTITQFNNNGTTTLLTATSASTGYAGASGTNNAGAAARAGALNINTSGSAAFEFTLTPASGITLTFADLLFGSRSTTTGPQAWTLRSSADGYTSDIATGTVANNSTWTLQDASAFSFAITSATTFRLFGYNGTGAPSANTANWRIDDLQFVYTASGGVSYTWTGDGLGGVWQNVGQGHFGSPYANSLTTPSTFTGTGEVVALSGAVQSGGITVNSDAYSFTNSTLELGAGGVTVTAALHTTTINSIIAGAVGLNKAGAGRLVVTGNNTYTGTTNISAGTLAISADSNLGTTTNAVQLGGGRLQTTASMTLDAARSVTGSGSVEIGTGTTLTIPGTLNTAALTVEGAGTLVLTGTAPTASTLTLAGAATVASTNAIASTAINSTNTTGTATITGAIDFGTTARTITVADGSAAIDLALTGGITLGGATSNRITKVGDGTLAISGTNTHAGLRIGIAAATPSNGGTVFISDADDLGANQLQFNAGTLNVQGGAVTTPIGVSIGAGQLPGGATFTGSPITFQGTSSIFKATGTTIAHRITANSNVTLSGGLNVSGGTGISSGLTIAGSGTVILPASANTIAENITVDGGNLEISGALTGATIPTITTTNLGILSGISTGATGIGAVTATTDGLIAPGTIGDAAGLLVMGGNLQIQSGAALDIDIGGTSPDAYDSLSVTGSVTLGGNLFVSLFGGYAPAGTDALTIILNDGGDPVSGTFDGLPEGAAVGSTGFFVSYAGGDGNDVVLTTVPEPGSAVMLLSGLALLGGRRRRR